MICLSKGRLFRVQVEFSDLKRGFGSSGFRGLRFFVRFRVAVLWGFRFEG